MALREGTGVTAFAAIGVAVAALAVAAACASPAPRVQLTDGEDGGRTASSWGITPCADCVRASCADERSRCATEPTCARHLDCLEACPAVAGGDPEEACVARCPPVEGSAAESARDAFTQCRLAGRGGACAECSGGRFQHPLLNQTCPATGDDPEADCASCSVNRCCQTRAACNDDPGCVAFRDCYFECKDTACEDQCIAAHDGSFIKYFAHTSCLITRCESTCTTAPTACDTCISSECGDEKMACDSDHDCKLLLRCQGRCTTLACYEACRQRFPASASLTAAVALCPRDRCKACN